MGFAFVISHLSLMQLAVLSPLMKFLGNSQDIGLAGEAAQVSLKKEEKKIGTKPKVQTARHQYKSVA